MLPVVLALAATSSAQENPTSSGEPRSTPAGSHSTLATSPGGSQEAAPSDADLAAMRAEATGQLRAINPSAVDDPATSTAAGLRTGAAPSSTTSSATTTESAADKQLRDILQERLRLFDEYDKATASFKKAAYPEPNPEQRAKDARADLVQLQAQLAQAATNPEVLLPPSFSVPGASAGARPSVSAEMKEALEAATGEVKEWKAKLESLRTEVANWEGLQNARCAERDKLFQVVAAMKARGADREEPTVPASASSSSAPARLARERQVNAEWKSRVEVMRLQAVEAQIALEAKLAGVRELAVQVGQLQVQVAEKKLELMQRRYNAAAEQQERELKEKAAAEESKARRSDDPLERFRARRLADLLELEAQVVKLEQALATAPPPSLEEQRSLADHAERDFALIKQLLDDGRISRLDAIRLNNDFRRIGPERDRLLRNEMAIAEARLQYYEDALTAVEIELLQDSLHDRYEHDMLRERLSPSRWAEGEAIVAGLERSHRAMLVRRALGPGAPDRLHGPDARPDYTPAGDPRRGVRLHPDPYLLGPRPGADRAGHDHAGRARVPARGQGPDAAGAGIGASPALGPPLGRVRDGRDGGAGAAHRSDPTPTHAPLADRPRPAHGQAGGVVRVRGDGR